MTSPVHGSVADLYYNGKVLSQFFKNASFSASRDTAETTTFKKASKTYIPGLKDTTLSADGLLDDDPTQTALAPGVGLGIESNLQAAILSTAPAFVTYFPAGAQNGLTGYSLYAHESSLEVSSDIGDVAALSVSFQGTDAMLIGKVVATGSPTSPSLAVDGGLGAANNIATAVIQVVSSSALSFKIQDSADNTTFADVGVAVAAASAGSYLIERTNIRRYTRLMWTGTGTFTAVLGRGV